MKTYNALSKSFTDEVKTQMGGGKSIDEAFEDVKSAIIDNNFDEPNPTHKPDSNIPTPAPTPEPTSTPTPTKSPVTILTEGDGIEPGKDNKVYHYVNLDLPSKTMWATCNVGADLASDDGLLFQFGRVDGYKYNDSSNQFRTNAQNLKDGSTSEYIPITSSGKTYNEGETLQPADDAVNVNMGGKWRMPTCSYNSSIEQYEGDWGELLNNTTHEVITINGVQGMLFTSNINGHQLFIPFAGYWYNGTFISAGSDARVWSSYVAGLVYHAYLLHCYSSGTTDIDNYPRSNAFSVRGVFKK